MGAPDDFAVLQDRGGIAQRAAGALGVFIDVPDAQGNGSDAFRGFGERGQIGADKIGAQEQIARRVTAQEQFRRQDKFRALRAGFLIAGNQFLPVCRKIADGRIKLEQADFQLRRE